MTFDIKLSAEDVKKAIVDYLFANGYTASVNDIKFDTSLENEGHWYGATQTKVAVFNGASIKAGPRKSRQIGD